MGENIKKAFTLAEIMIVLTVIGVLTAILLPNAIRNTPDENVMKFKKANNTLAQVIGELVANPEYYYDGDLGKRPDGTLIDGTHTGDVTYFCKSFANLISAKSVNCSSAALGALPEISYIDIRKQYGGEYGRTLPDAKAYLDSACAAQAATIGAEIVTTDNIVYFQTAPDTTFGSRYNNGSGRNFAASAQEGAAHYIPSSKLGGLYKIYCIDVDGIGTGEAPFGYGIRADGKIINGARADAWVQKSVQDKE